MRPATAGAVTVERTGCLLVLMPVRGGPRVVLYWALVIPSVLLIQLFDGPWDLPIAIVAVIVFLVHIVRDGRRHGRASGPSRGAMAEGETT